jgi:hypothetical protein
VFWQFLYESGLICEEVTLLGESTLVHEGVFEFPLRGAYRALGGGSLGSDHARLLRGFAPSGERRRYPKASSMPSAACLPIEGIQCEYLSRVIAMEACPRRCWTSFGWTPRPSSRVAHVCLRSCQRMGGRPACLSSGLRWRLTMLGASWPTTSLRAAKAHRVGEVGSAVKARLLFILGETVIYGLLKRCEQWRR